MQLNMNPTTKNEFNSTTTTATDHHNQSLGDKRVRDLMVDKRRLVEVPYTATLAHTMNALVANRVVAVPVAAPPGHWIGAGGSMIMESDKQTGVVRKHYIGMVTMLDILAHIAGGGVDDIHHRHMKGGDHHDSGFDLDRKMAVPVSSVIGHSVEGLSLWTLNPNTSVLDCMEVFSKGIHRALIPVDGQAPDVAVAGVELAESASSYQMLTQMDVLKFIKELDSELEGIMGQSVKELEAITEKVYAITDRTKLREAIRCMKSGLLSAVPIVGSRSNSIDENHGELINGKGRELVGTFSATDLRGCHLATLQSWMNLSALEFTEIISTSPLFTGSNTFSEASSTRELVTCQEESSLGEVVDKLITKQVHRIWVIDQQGLLNGVVSSTDVTRVVRQNLLPQL